MALEKANCTTTPRRWYLAMTYAWRDNLNWFWLLYGLGEASATMLIGAALFKPGILQGARSPAFYARLALLGYLVGGTARARRPSTPAWLCWGISSAERCARSGRGGPWPRMADAAVPQERTGVTNVV